MVGGKPVKEGFIARGVSHPAPDAYDILKERKLGNIGQHELGIRQSQNVRGKKAFGLTVQPDELLVASQLVAVISQHSSDTVTHQSVAGEERIPLHRPKLKREHASGLGFCFDCRDVLVNRVDLFAGRREHPVKALDAP
jgi:hypothetical protein